MILSSSIRCARHYWFCAADPCGFGGTYKQRERFNEAVFVDPQRRFFFTKNEKCGNNTARRTLQSLTAKRPLPEDPNLRPERPSTPLSCRSISEHLP